MIFQPSYSWREILLQCFFKTKVTFRNLKVVRSTQTNPQKRGSSNLEPRYEEKHAPILHRGRNKTPTWHMLTSRTEIREPLRLLLNCNASSNIISACLTARSGLVRSQFLGVFVGQVYAWVVDRREVGQKNTWETKGKYWFGTSHLACLGPGRLGRHRSTMMDEECWDQTLWPSCFAPFYSALDVRSL